MSRRVLTGSPGHLIHPLDPEEETMTPIEIKQFLQERKLATLQDMAFHFRMEKDAIDPMLDLWIRKGKVKKHDDNLGCRKGCCECDPATIITYEWIG